ncbi:hypothetical protein TeGR_g11582, partial [Tetraparma gracilis]
SNSKVCVTVGPLFIHQLQVIFLDLLTVYKVYSQKISEAVATQGALATRHDIVRKMRTVKKEVLKLLSVFIEKSGEPDSPPAQVAQGFLPPVLDPILLDYKTGVPQARDAEVLGLFTVVIDKLKGEVLEEVPRILDSTFMVTLEMITQNFEDHPEHRVKFFSLLGAVNKHCFSALFKLPADHQRYVVDSIVWSMKHTGRDISELGLAILLELLQNVQKAPDIQQGFYGSFLLPLISDVLAVLTDRLHKSGFRQHAELLALMFGLVARNEVTVRSAPDGAHAGMGGGGMGAGGMGAGGMGAGSMSAGMNAGMGMHMGGMPGGMQPGGMQPGMMQPGMMQPGMMQPGMMQPGMMAMSGYPGAPGSPPCQQPGPAPPAGHVAGVSGQSLPSGISGAHPPLPLRRGRWTAIPTRTLWTNGRTGIMMNRSNR